MKIKLKKSKKAAVPYIKNEVPKDKNVTAKVYNNMEKGPEILETYTYKELKKRGVMVKQIQSSSDVPNVEVKSVSSVSHQNNSVYITRNQKALRASKNDNAFKACNQKSLLNANNSKEILSKNEKISSKLSNENYSYSTCSSNTKNLKQKKLVVQKSSNNKKANTNEIYSPEQCVESFSSENNFESQNINPELVSSLVNKNDKSTLDNTEFIDAVTTKIKDEEPSQVWVKFKCENFVPKGSVSLYKRKCLNKIESNKDTLQISMSTDNQECEKISVDMKNKTTAISDVSIINLNDVPNCKEDSDIRNGKTSNDSYCELGTDCSKNSASFIDTSTDLTVESVSVYKRKCANRIESSKDTLHINMNKVNQECKDNQEYEKLLVNMKNKTIISDVSVINLSDAFHLKEDSDMRNGKTYSNDAYNELSTGCSKNSTSCIGTSTDLTSTSVCRNKTLEKNENQTEFTQKDNSSKQISCYENVTGMTAIPENLECSESLSVHAEDVSASNSAAIQVGSSDITKYGSHNSLNYNFAKSELAHINKLSNIDIFNNNADNIEDKSSSRSKFEATFEGNEEEFIKPVESKLNCSTGTLNENIEMNEIELHNIPASDIRVVLYRNPLLERMASLKKNMLSIEKNATNSCLQNLSVNAEGLLVSCNDINFLGTDVADVSMVKLTTEETNMPMDFMREKFMKKTNNRHEYTMGDISVESIKSSIVSGIEGLCQEDTEIPNAHLMPSSDETAVSIPFMVQRSINDTDPKIKTHSIDMNKGSIILNEEVESMEDIYALNPNLKILPIEEAKISMNCKKKNSIEKTYLSDCIENVPMETNNASISSIDEVCNEDSIPTTNHTQYFLDNTKPSMNYRGEQVIKDIDFSDPCMENVSINTTKTSADLCLKETRVKYTDIAYPFINLNKEDTNTFMSANLAEVASTSEYCTENLQIESNKVETNKVLISNMKEIWKDPKIHNTSHVQLFLDDAKSSLTYKGDEVIKDTEFSDPLMKNLSIRTTKASVDSCIEKNKVKDTDALNLNIANTNKERTKTFMSADLAGKAKTTEYYIENLQIESNKVLISCMEEVCKKDPKIHTSHKQVFLDGSKSSKTYIGDQFIKNTDFSDPFMEDLSIRTTKASVDSCMRKNKIKDTDVSYPIMTTINKEKTKTIMSTNLSSESKKLVACYANLIENSDSYLENLSIESTKTMISCMKDTTLEDIEISDASIVKLSFNEETFITDEAGKSTKTADMYDSFLENISIESEKQLHSSCMEEIRIAEAEVHSSNTPKISTEEIESCQQTGLSESFMKAFNENQMAYTIPCTEQESYEDSEVSVTHIEELAEEIDDNGEVSGNIGESVAAHVNMNKIQGMSVSLCEDVCVDDHDSVAGDLEVLLFESDINNIDLKLKAEEYQEFLLDDNIETSLEVISEQDETEDIIVVDDNPSLIEQPYARDSEEPWFEGFDGDSPKVINKFSNAVMKFATQTSARKVCRALIRTLNKICGAQDCESNLRLALDNCLEISEESHEEQCESEDLMFPEKDCKKLNGTNSRRNNSLFGDPCSTKWRAGVNLRSHRKSTESQKLSQHLTKVRMETALLKVPNSSGKGKTARRSLKRRAARLAALNIKIKIEEEEADDASSAVEERTHKKRRSSLDTDESVTDVSLEVSSTEHTSQTAKLNYVGQDVKSECVEVTKEFSLRPVRRSSRTFNCKSFSEESGSPKAQVFEKGGIVEHNYGTYSILKKKLTADKDQVVFIKYFPIVKTSKEKHYNCYFCRYSSVSKMEINNHLEAHKVNSMFQCLHCSFSSRLRTEFIRHSVVHTGEVFYVCSECNYRAGSLAALTHHKNVHKNLKPYRCNICGLTTERLRRMRRHVLRHKGNTLKQRTVINLYKCPCCTLQFKSGVSLTNHIKTHFTYDILRCPLCSFSSCQFVEAKNHVLSHENSEYRIFICKCCNTRVTGALNVIYHLKTHTDYFPCFACCNAFADYKTLKEHFCKRQHNSDDLIPESSASLSNDYSKQLIEIDAPTNSENSSEKQLEASPMYKNLSIATGDTAKRPSVNLIKNSVPRHYNKENYQTYLKSEVTERGLRIFKPQKRRMEETEEDEICIVENKVHSEEMGNEVCLSEKTDSKRMETPDPEACQTEKTNKSEVHPNVDLRQMVCESEKVNDEDLWIEKRVVPLETHDNEDSLPETESMLCQTRETANEMIDNELHQKAEAISEADKTNIESHEKKNMKNEAQKMNNDLLLLKETTNEAHQTEMTYRELPPKEAEGEACRTEEIGYHSCKLRSLDSETREVNNVEFQTETVDNEGMLDNMRREVEKACETETMDKEVLFVGKTHNEVCEWEKENSQEENKECQIEKANYKALLLEKIDCTTRQTDSESQQSNINKAVNLIEITDNGHKDTNFEANEIIREEMEVSKEKMDNEKNRMTDNSVTEKIDEVVLQTEKDNRIYQTEVLDTKTCQMKKKENKSNLPLQHSKTQVNGNKNIILSVNDQLETSIENGTQCNSSFFAAQKYPLFVEKRKGCFRTLINSERKPVFNTEKLNVRFKITNGKIVDAEESHPRCSQEKTGILNMDLSAQKNKTKINNDMKTKCEETSKRSMPEININWNSFDRETDIRYASINNNLESISDTTNLAFKSRERIAGSHVNSESISAVTNISVSNTMEFNSERTGLSSDVIGVKYLANDSSKIESQNEKINSGTDSDKTRGIKDPPSRCGGVMSMGTALQQDVFLLNDDVDIWEISNNEDLLQDDSLGSIDYSSYDEELDQFIANVDKELVCCTTKSGQQGRYSSSTGLPQHRSRLDVMHVNATGKPMEHRIPAVNVDLAEESDISKEPEHTITKLCDLNLMRTVDKNLCSRKQNENTRVSDCSSLASGKDGATTTLNVVDLTEDLSDYEELQERRKAGKNSNEESLKVTVCEGKIIDPGNHNCNRKYLNVECHHYNENQKRKRRRLGISLRFGCVCMYKIRIMETSNDELNLVNEREDFAMHDGISVGSVQKCNEVHESVVAPFGFCSGDNTLPASENNIKNNGPSQNEFAMENRISSIKTINRCGDIEVDETYSNKPRFAKQFEGQMPNVKHGDKGKILKVVNGGKISKELTPYQDDIVTHDRSASEGVLNHVGNFDTLGKAKDLNNSFNCKQEKVKNHLNTPVDSPSFPTVTSKQELVDHRKGCSNPPTLSPKEKSKQTDSGSWTLLNQTTFEPIFVCNFCSFGTDKLFKLNIHLAEHSNLNPFECSFCPQTFSLLKLLKTHLKSH